MRFLARVFLFGLQSLSIVACRQGENSKNKIAGDFSIRLEKVPPHKVVSDSSEQLQRYFDKHQLTPSVIVNNVDNEQTNILLGTHRIKWILKNEKVSVQIDNDRFHLDDKVTLNSVHNDGVDSVNFANNWDQIKLFKYKSGEIIGIRFSYQPCTGLGCNVNYFLIYDVATKTKNFFGTFRTDSELALFNFRKDAQPDYLSKTFRGDSHGDTQTAFITECYTRKANGHFIRQLNAQGVPYEVRVTTFPNDPTKSTTYLQHWFEKVW